MSMKTAFHVHAVRSSFAGTSPDSRELDGMLVRAARAGFDGIDISDTWPIQDLDADALDGIRRSVRKHRLHIPVVSCMSRTLCDPVLGERNFRAIAGGIEAAARLGAEIVNVSLSYPRTPEFPAIVGGAGSTGCSRRATQEDVRITVERLKSLARLAAPHGLQLSIEMHDRSPTDTPEALLAVLEAVDEENVGVNPDLSNAYRAYEVPETSWRTALPALAARANMWHVHNLQRVHFAEISRAAFLECTLEQGDIDYRQAFSMMHRAGYRGWVVVEFKGTGDPWHALLAGKAYVDAILSDID